MKTLKETEMEQYLFHKEKDLQVYVIHCQGVFFPQ